MSHFSHFNCCFLAVHVSGEQEWVELVRAHGLRDSITRFPSVSDSHELKSVKVDPQTAANTQPNTANCIYTCPSIYALNIECNLQSVNVEKNDIIANLRFHIGCCCCMRLEISDNSPLCSNSLVRQIPCATAW